MDDQIKQIAERLRGLRDVLELTAEDIARDCEISAEEYRLAETGDYDISVSMLQKIARKYGIALDALMFGEEPKMSSYFLTRAGKGTSIERTKAYKYQSLAARKIPPNPAPSKPPVLPKAPRRPQMAQPHPPTTRMQPPPPRRKPRHLPNLQKQKPSLLQRKHPTQIPPLPPKFRQNLLLKPLWMLWKPYMPSPRSMSAPVPATTI